MTSGPRPASVRAFAEALLEAETLEGKLASPPTGLPDEPRGVPTRIGAPARPAGWAWVPKGHARVPPPAGMADVSQRIRILHALANHELQAAECFAWALLAFPEAPTSFRRGCLRILADEQAHMRLYLDRVVALGGTPGSFPVSNLFWRALAHVEDPLDFVCVLGLTFENANLDFGNEHLQEARRIGDEATAAALETVHRDEIRHVQFAWHWLERLAPDADPIETWTSRLHRPLGPARARGKTFDRAAREAAGLSAAFIDHLEATRATAPGGAPR